MYQLLLSERIPVPIYSLQVLALSSFNIKPLNLSVISFFTILLKTSNVSIITECQPMFNLVLSTVFKLQIQYMNLKSVLAKCREVMYTLFIYLFIDSFLFVCSLYIYMFATL